MLAAKCANYLAKANKWVRAARANDKCRNIETMETLSTWWVPQFPPNGDRETLLRKNLSWKWNCSGRLGSQPSMVCGAQNTNVLAADPPQPKQLQLCKLLRCCSVPQRYLFWQYFIQLQYFFPFNMCIYFNMWWSCHGMDVLQWTVCGLKTLMCPSLKQGRGASLIQKQETKLWFRIWSLFKTWFQNSIPLTMECQISILHSISHPSHPWYELGEHGLVISTELLALKPWHGLAVWPSCG